MAASSADAVPGARGVALLVALAVLVTVGAYPPVDRGWLAFVMLAPLAAALEGRRPRAAFAIVYAWFFASGAIVVRWLVHPLVVEYAVPAAAAWTFLLLLVAAYGLAAAAAGAAYAALRPRVPLALSPLVFAACHTLAEWLRAEPLRLPWFLSGHALWSHPLWLQTAELGGAYAVGFAVAAAGAGLGIGAVRRRPLALAAPALVLAAAAGFGALRLAQLDPDGSIRIGVVQAAVPQAERFQTGSAVRNTRRHAALTRALAAREALDLAVWSETSVDDDLDATPALNRELARLADETGVPLVTGAPRSAGGRRTNATVLLEPGAGLVESYDKQVLVPFSEYDPLLAPLAAPLLGPVMDGEPFTAGREPTVLRRGPLPFSTPICFEITYPALARRFRAAGARLLLNLSNDAWFGDTGYLRMHFVHAVLRAVELRSWVVRAANTGISGAIDPAGRVVAELPVFEEGSFAVGVGEAGPAPLYARAGNAPVLSALVAIALAPALRPRRRPRRARARARG